MRLCLLLSAAILTGGFTGSSCQREDRSLSSLLGKDLYEKSFPHHHAIYTYEALIKAAASYPSFAGEGDPTQRKRELAAFFAHIGHETTNGGGPVAEEGPSSKTSEASYAWGPYYTKKHTSPPRHFPQYTTTAHTPY